MTRPHDRQKLTHYIPTTYAINDMQTMPKSPQRRPTKTPRSALKRPKHPPKKPKRHTPPPNTTQTRKKRVLPVLGYF